MARSFDGATQWLEYSGAVVTNFPLSVSAWINLSSLASNCNVFDLAVKAAADARLVLIRVLTDGTVKAYSTYSGSAQSGASSTSAGAVTTGVWYHVAAVMTSTTSRTVFCNGAAGTTDSTTVTAAATSDTTSVATYYASGTRNGYLAGAVAEVTVWNVALTANEIAALAKGVLSTRIRRGSLVSYWPLNGLLSPEPDLSGAARNFTLNGSPPATNHAPATPFSSRWWLPNPLLAGTPPTLIASCDLTTLAEAWQLAVVNSDAAVTVDAPAPALVTTQAPDVHGLAESLQNNATLQQVEPVTFSEVVAYGPQAGDNAYCAESFTLPGVTLQGAEQVMALEVPTPAVTLTAPDLARLAEAGPAVGFAATDAAVAGTEGTAVGYAINAGDQAAAAEMTGNAAAVPANDAARWADGPPLLAAAAAAADKAAAAETLPLVALQAPPDSAAAAEAFAPVGLTASDNAALGERNASAITLLAADALSAADGAAVLGRPWGVDVADALDAAALLAMTGAADQVAVPDNATLAARLAAGDGGTALEVVLGNATVAAADAGTGTDRAGTGNALGAGDSATVAEGVPGPFGVSGADQAAVGEAAATGVTPGAVHASQSLIGVDTGRQTLIGVLPA